MGSVLVSNYSTRKRYQVLNLDEDSFILRGWNNNPVTKGKKWKFICDETRYGDNLLHCTVKLDQAKSLQSKEENFYRPNRVPDIDDDETVTFKRLQKIHEQLNHTSSQEMNHIIAGNPKEFNTSTNDIKV